MFVDSQREASVERRLRPGRRPPDPRYEHANTVRMNFEAWADALEGRAPYRFTSDQLLANISILDAVTRSAAADGKPIAL